MQALQSARSVDPVQRRPGPLALLLSRRFGPLFATQFLSAFNDNALKNALVLMVAYRADAGDALSAGLLIPLAGGLFILPFFLCSASAGALADGSDKAWLARVIKLIEIAVMLAAAVGIATGRTALLLALLFAMGVEAAFFGPIKYAILPVAIPTAAASITAISISLMTRASHALSLPSARAPALAGGLFILPFFLCSASGISSPADKASPASAR
jgi:hypothetical protein